MIDAVIERMRALLAPLRAADRPRQYFHAVYLRTTIAVAEAIAGGGGFIDPDWAERWDVTFARLYLDALEADMSGGGPRPGRGSSRSDDGRPCRPLNHVLLGMNAHINFDLARALVMVIADEEFDDPALIARREEDSGRRRDTRRTVAAEDDELVGVLRPRIGAQPACCSRCDKRGSQRFLRESREKVWAGQRGHAQPGPPPGRRGLTPPSSPNWRSSARPRFPR